MDKEPIDIVNNYLIMSRDMYRLTGLSEHDDSIQDFAFQKPRRALVCKSGLRLSVQAGENNYCSPKNNDGPWATVEVMVLKGVLLLPDEWPENGGDSVYGYVPVELVNRELAANGGIDCIPSG